MRRKKNTNEENIEVIIGNQLEKLLDFNNVNKDVSSLPRLRSFSEMCDDAQKFRDSLSSKSTKVVCSVCSMYVLKATLCASSDADGFIAVNGIPNLDLLRADVEPTDELPRHAKTTFKFNEHSYCMQPAACNGDKARVCHTCYTKLCAETVPKNSLVRFDTGGLPICEETNETFPQLTMIEEKLLSQYRSSRIVMIMKPPAVFRPLDTYQIGHRGHVIAFPNVPVKETRRVLLPALDSLPEHIKVVFLTKASPEEMNNMCKNAPALHVRGKVVLQWADHLMKVRHIMFEGNAINIMCYRYVL